MNLLEFIFDNPEFNPLSTCKMCGCKTISTQYKNLNALFPTVKTDYLIRQCGRCSYSWWEKPITLNPHPPITLDVF